jgi:hypothetical protein
MVRLRILCMSVRYENDRIKGVTIRFSDLRISNVSGICTELQIDKSKLSFIIPK